MDTKEGGAYAARFLRLTNRHFHNIVEEATHYDVLGVGQSSADYMHASSASGCDTRQSLPMRC